MIAAVPALGNRSDVRHSQGAFVHIMALLRFFANSSFCTYSSGLCVCNVSNADGINGI